MDRDPHGNKIGRNDKCWCGSGEKYKNCHYGREFQKELGLGRYKKTFFEIEQATKFCSCSFDHQHCTKHVVRAHSISKAASLQYIAEKGHVITLEIDPDLPGEVDSVTFKKVGIGKASTVQAFCSHHDASLFGELDRLDLTDKPAFFWQLFYRTVCFERFRKVVAAGFALQTRSLDYGFSFSQQVSWQDFVSRQHIGHSAGFQHLDRLRIVLEKMYQERQFAEELRYLYFFIPKKMPLAISGVFQPDIAPDGQHLQVVNQMRLGEDGRVIDADLHSLCMSMLPNRSGTLLAMCALASHSHSVDFMRIFRNVTESTVDSFSGIGLVKIENAFFDPRFISSLTSLDKHKLETLHRFGIGVDLKPAEMSLAVRLGIFTPFDRLDCVSNM